MKTIPPDDTTEFTVLNLNILFCSQFRCKFENCRWQSKNSKTQFYFTIIVISGWKPQLLHGTLHNQIDPNQINKDGSPNRCRRCEKPVVMACLCKIEVIPQHTKEIVNCQPGTAILFWFRSFEFSFFQFQSINSDEIFTRRSGSGKRLSVY